MFKTYTPLNTATLWTDIATYFNNVELGIFGGYSKNMGANDNIIGEIYGLGTNIESLYRIAPRIAWKVDKVKFVFETLYTAAKYGSAYDSKGIPTNLTKSDDIRLLFAVYYYF